MAISEPDRHHMYEVAKNRWDERSADALMAHLPPVGWGEVATKRDLGVIRGDIETFRNHYDVRFESIDQRFDSIEARLARLEDNIISQGRTFLLANFPSVITMGAMFFGTFFVFGQN